MTASMAVPTVETITSNVAVSGKRWGWPESEAMTERPLPTGIVVGSIP